MEEVILKNEKQITKKQAVVKMIIAIISAVVVLVGVVVGGGFIIIKKNFTTKPIYRDRIDDGFLKNYQLVFPAEMVGYYHGDCSLVTDFKIEELKVEFEKSGYVTEYATDTDNNACLVIGLYTGQNVSNMFVVRQITDFVKSKYDNGNYCYLVECLCVEVEGCIIPYPKYVKIGENGNATFEDYVAFYQKSLTDIVKVDYDAKTIVINAIDRELGSKFNALVEISYQYANGENHIKAKRIYSLNA
ncbi:MAG: hypothetical protein ACI4M6_00065 [Christensenellaceae bacterium]